MIGTVGEMDRYKIVKSLQLGGGKLVGIDIDFRVGEGFQLA